MKEARLPVSEINRPRNTHHLIGHTAIAGVVDDFYERVQQHPALAVPFAVVDDWDEHKARLTHFWWVSLGGEPYAPYQYRVAEKHMAVGVTSTLVDDWLALFHTTLNDHLPESLVDPWFERARRMGDSIRLVSEFYRRKAERPPT